MPAQHSLVANYVMYSHDFFLEESVESIISFVDRIFIARTTKPWFGSPGDLSDTDAALARIRARYGDKIEVYTDEFEDEQTQRNFLLTVSRARGYAGALIVDCDEVFTGAALSSIGAYIDQHDPAALQIPYRTFIKDASFCIAKPYETGLFYVKLQPALRFTWARRVNVDLTVMEYPDPEILHFSYIRKNDEEIQRKLQTFMHANDTDWTEWYERAFVRFHPGLKNFHPVWPNSWTGLEMFNVNRFPSSVAAKLSASGHLFYASHVCGRNPLKLHLGCGPVHLDGYLNLDLYDTHADARMDITDLNFFEPESVDEIFMNAVFEHLYTFEQEHALAHWFRVLKPGARLIIQAIPDFAEIAKAYLAGAPGHSAPRFDIEQVARYTHGAYTLQNKLGQIHKDVFTKEKVRHLLERAGFEIAELASVCWGSEANPVNINVQAVKPAAKIPDPSVKYHRALDLLDKGELDQALALLQEVTGSSPAFEPAHNDLAAVYAHRGDLNSALRHLRLAHQLNPGNLVVRKNLAEVCAMAGREEEAAGLLRGIIESDPHDAESIALLKRLEELHPDSLSFSQQKGHHAAS